ncbi:MAG: hypothetical protein R2688_03200 [Fimbriimonadaceae bacterium]
MPIGLRIDGTEEQIKQAISSGVKDVIIDLPSTGTGWKKSFEMLDAAGIRYSISFNNPAPSAEVIRVEPEAYRIPNLQYIYDLNLSLAGAKRARALLVSQRTTLVRQDDIIDVVDGKLRVKNTREYNVPHTLLIYPVVDDLETPDYWEGFDSYRDQVLRSFKENPPGPGFRGLINPFGRIPNDLSRESHFVPTSRFFQMELETYLREKYGNIQTAMRAWDIRASDVSTFADLSKLVPLWAESRGLGQIWNTSSNRLISSEPTSSNAWTDIQSVIASSANRRYERLVQVLETQIKVPIIQDWNGWGSAYEDQKTGLDGVGAIVTADSIISVMNGVARPLSTVRRGTGSQFTWATDVRLPAEGSFDLAQISRVSHDMGMRGWFFRCTNPEQMTQVASLANLNTLDAEGGLPNVLYYPEAARGVAFPTVIAPNTWWLPGPGRGEVIDYGDGIEGYSYQDRREDFIAMWASSQPVQTKLRLMNPETWVYAPLGGGEIETKIRKNDVELTVTPQPIIFRNPREVPVPMPTWDITNAMVAGVVTKFKALADPNGTELFRLSDYSKAFDRTPGDAYIALRQQWRELAIKAAPYVWMQAEKAQDNAFSATRMVQGASGNKVLMIRAPLAGQINSYQAKYTLGRSTVPNLDLWVSGRIPAHLRHLVDFQTAGKSYKITGPPVSFYGDGLEWYHVGRVDMAREGETELIIDFPAGQHEEFLVDVVMLSRDDFAPTGPQPPMGWLLQALSEGG